MNCVEFDEGRLTVAGIPRTGLLRRDTGATPGAKNQQDEKSRHGDFCSDAVQGAHVTPRLLANSETS